ncbi:MAG: hypothetical protein G01um101433_34 [Parcubacteria group bacterium Gr01-1014_33]|nr:MAG: hypothetical protein G01um101433_34 [Parcubacteria group bacterium Gr01-1014_33]
MSQEDRAIAFLQEIKIVRGEIAANKNLTPVEKILILNDVFLNIVKARAACHDLTIVTVSDIGKLLEDEALEEVLREITLLKTLSASDGNITSIVEMEKGVLTKKHSYLMAQWQKYPKK